MRLAAISFFSDGPVHQGFVRLGDVTALIGANDVGKTRLLRLIETALSDPEACDMIDLFGVASAEEVAAFIDPDAFDRFGIQDRVDDVAEFAADLEAPALEDELRVGVRLPGQSGYMSAWRYGRCPAELGDARSQAVQEAVGGPTPDTPFEPVKLEYLGRADPRVLPEAVIVPTAPGEIQREVGRVATTLCCVLRELAAAWPGREDEDPTAVFALDEPDADIDPLDLDEEVEPIEIGPDDPDPDWMSPAPAAPVDRAGELSWRWLVDEDQDASQVNRAAVVACRALQDLAGGLLPTFITSDYRLEITPGQPTAIAQGDRVRVQLMRRDTAPESCDLVDDADGLRFDLEEAASGYRLWIELALRETVARARMLIHILYQSSRCLQLAAIGDLDTPLDDVRAVVRATLERLRDPRSAAPTDIEPVIEAGEKELEHRPGDPDPRLFARPRPRLYLVDEPEQRLHPRLQRRAARWLTTLMSEWGSQCVVATHSVAFITPSAHTRAYQLTRTDEPDHAEIAQLDPSSLTPYADLAETVGLDRGELLTRWRAFVFAEPLLSTLLGELAGDQLEHSDIRLIPLPASGDRPPPEIALLADLTAAPFILLLAIAPTERITQLRDHPAHRLPPADDRSAETASAAAVLDLATQLELDIEILPLAVRHPFDLLHAGAIRRCAPARSDTPPFPGHQEAHQLHATTDRQESVPYPDFLQATYGITPDPATVRAVAQTMRHNHLPTDAQLTDALWQIERIALDAEAH